MTTPAMSPASATQPASVPDLSLAATRERLSPAAATGIARLADLWRLSSLEASALVGVSPRTWFRMKKGEHVGALSQDVLTRISLLTGVYKGLNLVFSKPLADEWVDLANQGPLYAGRRPIEIMIQGGIPKMIDVRRHIDALRGGL